MAARKSEKKPAKVDVAVDSSTEMAKAPARKKVKGSTAEVVAAGVVVAEVVVAEGIAAAEPVAPAPPDVSAIRARAYEISQTGGGSPMDNWLQAERELSGGRG